MQEEKSQYLTIKFGEDSKYLVLNRMTNQYIDIRTLDVVNCIPYTTAHQWDKFWLQFQKRHEQLISLIQANKIQQINKRINEPEILIQYKGLDDWTFLHYAAASSDSQIIPLLFSKGINPHARSKKGLTALHLASINGNVENASAILSCSKSLLDSQDNQGNTAMHYAAEFGESQMLTFLRQAGAKDMPNYKGLRPSDLIPKSVPTSSQRTLLLSDLIFYKKLGSGSFGDVFLASIEGMKEFLAVKVLRKEKIKKHKLQKYTFAEKNIMKELEHPFIMNLKFALQNNQLLFLGIDFCPGGDIAKYIQRRGRISEEEAKKFANEIYLAICTLHSKNILYRDLKPENVMIDQQGHAVLSDFGLAKENYKQGDICTEFVGSLAYVPYQILERRGHNRMADWYLFGVVIYFMLHGDPPYFAKSRKELQNNIRTADLKFDQSLGPEVKNLISRLLDRNPKTRLGVNPKDISSHPWFMGVDWGMVSRREQVMDKPAPFCPPSQRMSMRLTLDSKYDKYEGWTFVDEITFKESQ